MCLAQSCNHCVLRTLDKARCWCSGRGPASSFYEALQIDLARRSATLLSEASERSLYNMRYVFRSTINDLVSYVSRQRASKSRVFEAMCCSHPAYDNEEHLKSHRLYYLETTAWPQFLWACPLSRRPAIARTSQLSAQIRITAPTVPKLRTTTNLLHHADPIHSRYLHSTRIQIRTKPSLPSALVARVHQSVQEHFRRPPLYRKARLVLRHPPTIAPACHVVNDGAVQACVCDARLAVDCRGAEIVGFGGCG
jgi:hypothetical protein